MTSKTKTKPPRLAKTGAALAPGLTVLSTIDGGSVDPVYIVWNENAWCPMACKAVESWDAAKREAEILGGMAHPNIVRLYELRSPGLLLMPFLEGTSLATALDTNPTKRFEVSDALRVTIHAAAALSHIHAKGYVHLDVKPDNFIVTADGRPVLFDFGTARHVYDVRPKEVTGTDAYICPEECELGQVSPASDVFSLGVMLYELLTGHLPFGKGTARTPFPQLKKTAVGLGKFQTGASARVENLIFACLERQPRFRPDIADIITTLHSQISSGPRMWPSNFEPLKVQVNEHALKPAKCRSANCVSDGLSLAHLPG